MSRRRGATQSRPLHSPQLIATIMVHVPNRRVSLETLYNASCVWQTDTTDAETTPRIHPDCRRIAAWFDLCRPRMWTDYFQTDNAFQLPGVCACSLANTARTSADTDCTRH